jgi:hypothetical protein
MLGDTTSLQSTIASMGDLIQPNPVAEERDSSRRTIVIAVVVVMAIAVIAAFLLRSQPRTASGPPAYASSVKLSDFKMAAVKNFIGATITYLDGTVTNSGNQTVTRVIVDVKFKDSMGQLAQQQAEMPLQVLKTTGPYPEAWDFKVSPLGPGQSQAFRLAFDHISEQWDRQYPDIEITDVAVK